MTEDKKNIGKTILIIASAVVVIALIVAGIYFLRKTEKKEETPMVGSIDRDKVLAIKRFEPSFEKLKQATQKAEKEFEKLTRDLDESDPEDMKKIAQLRMQYQQELLKKSNQIINPVYKEAEAAVAAVAVENNMSTVLDKTIVVCGAKDITDEVIAKLEGDKEVSMPDEQTLQKLSERSTIGYFDREVITNLPDFREAEKKVMQVAAQYQEKFKEKAADLNDQQRQQLQLMMMSELQRVQEDIYAPLYRQVNRTVKRVAKADNLDLVVNKENVMYGGRNITDEVADQLIEKKTE